MPAIRYSIDVLLRQIGERLSDLIPSAAVPRQRQGRDKVGRSYSSEVLHDSFILESRAANGEEEHCKVPGGNTEIDDDDGIKNEYKVIRRLGTALVGFSFGDKS